MAGEDFPTSTRPTIVPGAMIDLAIDNELLRFQYYDDEKGLQYESVFWLRPIDKDQRKRLLKKHTKAVFKNHQRFEETDWDDYTDDLLDLGIVKWEHVRNFRTKDELACERIYKEKLPARLKLAIVKVISGGELDEQMAASKNG